MSSLETTTSSALPMRSPLWPELRGSLRENSPLLLLIALFAPAPFVVAWLNDILVMPYSALALAYVGFAGYCGIAVFCAFAIWYLYHRRILKTPDFEKTYWSRARARYLTRDRIILALPILLLWPITATGFSYLKSVMWLVNPFYADPWLHAWDRVLHFGIDPWRLLAPLLNHPPVTFVINFSYTLWFFVIQTALVLQAAATGNRQLRMQFLLTMALAWVVVGNVAATLLSSAGPCYYALVVGDAAPYGALMDYLHEVSSNISIPWFGGAMPLPLTALTLQDFLWQSHVNGDFGLARGISAAPSMHIASTWVVARLCFALGRRAAIFGALFLALIFVGSIHLGWHYALDGYIAVLLAWLLWRIVGWMLNRPAMQRLLWPAGMPRAG